MSQVEVLSQVFEPEQVLTVFLSMIKHSLPTINAGSITASFIDDDGRIEVTFIPDEEQEEVVLN